MAHLKRHKVPKNWPIPRKGTAYVVKPNFDQRKGIPLLIILRDILQVAQNRKEVKKALNGKNILLNGKVAKDEKNTALLFDVITIVPSKKNYKVGLSENGKFKIDEIKSSEADKKVAKVIGKKTLKGKKTQINLSDGRNFIVPETKDKIKVNDSVLVEFKEKKIGKCLQLKEKANAIVFSGKHSGDEGVINKIESENKMAELKVKGNKVNVLIKQLMVIE